MEFGDYHVNQVINNAPFRVSMKDIYKHVEIWQTNHAIEIYKILKGVFPDMEDEVVHDIPDDDNTSEDESDEYDDWMRMFNESFDNLKCPYQ